MENNKRISELLVETGAYSDLEEPVILTSGALGIYFINTEKLCQDGGEWKDPKKGHNSAEMIKHAVKMTEEHPTFKEVIDILTEKVEEIMASKDITQENFEDFVISGGQRRDWIFSGPIAYKLKLNHVSLYKDGKIELVSPAGDVNNVDTLDKLYAIHGVDLLTEASSCCKEPNGWVPNLRRHNAEIKDLISVVSRLQGGEENLADIGVNAHSFVSISEGYLKDYSNNPERALEYKKNPDLWAENYIKEHGINALVPTFDPKGEKLDRAKKFLKRYEKVLKESGHIASLDMEVNERYGLVLIDFMEDKK